MTNSGTLASGYTGSKDTMKKTFFQRCGVAGIEEVQLLLLETHHMPALISQLKEQ